MGHYIGLAITLILLACFFTMAAIAVYGIIIGPIWHIGIKGRINWQSPFDRGSISREDSAGQ